ncbi:MAG: DNA/RNA helicase domain-containing protein, partial [Actinomycetota bacterium]|nr:DNA/RNA helicase domain-containing protein [Actinomycetota bacterium]
MRRATPPPLARRIGASGRERSRPVTAAREHPGRAASRTGDDKKKVIIVEGGPGTGKSVIAVNLLVKLIANGHVASYVTKNSAPRQVYTSYLTGSMRRSSVENLFRSSGQFIGADSNDFDALIVDEAHRLKEKSGLYSNQGDNQIKEIINASNVSVFFIDEDQRIHIKDIGRKEEIRKWAEKFDAEVIETELSSQFRCNGSDGYLAWVDHTLQIRDTANTDLSDIDYDFQVF